MATALAASASAVDPSCRADGCLREQQWLGSYPKSALVPYAEPGVSFDHGYTVHRIRFFTNGREAMATVTVPFDEPKLAAPARGWHVVANAHGTVGLEDPCAVGNGVWGAGLAGYFGARRMIGVTVDYPGLGTAGLHAYLDRESAGTSLLDGLRATRELARALGIPISGRYAIAGLSQGGHATLAAAALKADYAPELDVRAYAVAGPASGWEEHWSQGVRIVGGHIPVHAMLVYSWAKAYGWQDLPLWTPAVAKTIDATMTKRCVSGEPGETILEQLPHDPAELFDPTLLQEYRTRKWSKVRALHDAFEKNAIRALRSTGPLRVYQGGADLVIPEHATRELVDSLRASGVDIEYVVVPEGGHADVAFHFLAMKQHRTDDAIAWLRQQLDRPAPRGEPGG